MEAVGIVAFLLVVAAFLAFLVYMYRLEQSIRVTKGFTTGRTLDLDSRNLYSARYGLAGRPDRIVRENGFTIPEEWKSSRQVYDSHRAQMGVYFILIEEDTGVAPPHGYVVLAGGRRERVENTPELRAWVLKVSAQIRSAKRRLNEEIEVSQPPGKCRACGAGYVCGQRCG
jgi:CRISPR/Cas system-associated exonuclease Cas4 (RecB family)